MIGLGQRSLPLVGIQVGRAGQHDVLLRAVVQAAQHQPVGVGVRHHLVDLGDHDFIRVPAQTSVAEAVTLAFRGGQADDLNILHLQAGHGQNVGQLQDGQVNIDVIFQPRKRYLHGIFSFFVIC